MTNRESAAHAFVESMKQRFLHKGFQIHPSIEFRQTNNNGIGIFPSSDISKSEILLVVPEFARFRADTVTARLWDLQLLMKEVELRCEQWSESVNPSEFSTALVIKFIFGDLTTPKPYSSGVSFFANNME